MTIPNGLWIRMFIVHENKNFIPIFVINLLRSSARRVSIEGQAKNLGITVKFIEAIDGEEISDVKSVGYDRRANRREYGRLLTKGEIGCYASHISAAKAFIATKEKYAIILEDDASIDEDFLYFYQNALDVLGVIEQDMKLVNLCKVSAPSKRSSEIVHSLQHSISFYETYEFPTVARGIMWSRNGAAEFLKNGSVIAKPVDHFFKDWLTRNKGGYCLGNAVVKGMGFTSDIGSGTTRGKLKMIEAIRHDIARGKRDLINDLNILKRKFKARYDK